MREGTSSSSNLDMYTQRTNPKWFAWPRGRSHAKLISIWHVLCTISSSMSVCATAPLLDLAGLIAASGLQSKFRRGIFMPQALSSIAAWRFLQLQNRNGISLLVQRACFALEFDFIPYLPKKSYHYVDFVWIICLFTIKHYFEVQGPWGLGITLPITIKW